MVRKKEKEYLLNSLEDCFRELNSLIKQKGRKELLQISEEQFLFQSHFEIGAWIRNNWIREGRVTFIETLREKGARHIDDISAIILTSYYRYLHGRDINLDEQLAFYRDYWLINGTPKPDLYPQGVKSLSYFASRHYKIDETLGGCFYIMLEERVGKYWLYDYFYGWLDLEEKNKDELLKSDSSDTIKILDTLYKI